MTVEPLAPVTVAADYVIAAVGRDTAEVIVKALSAGWLTREEFETVKPLAAAVAELAGVAPPLHRGKP